MEQELSPDQNEINNDLEKEKMTRELLEYVDDMEKESKPDFEALRRKIKEVILME